MTKRDKDKDNQERKLAGNFLFRQVSARSMQQEEKETMDTVTSGEELLDATLEGDVDRIAQLVKDKVDVNYYSAKRKMAPIHAAAAVSWTASIALLEIEDLKVLVRDGLGRLPSTLAMEVAEDPRIAKLMMVREMEEAEAAGLDYKDVITSKVSLNYDPSI